MAAPSGRWTVNTYSVAAADRIAGALGLTPAVAQVLARRGYADVEDARRFLAAEERHDAWRLHDVERACDLILDHLRRGSRVVVHGDYDVDGVCSTAILVEVLRELGCDPAWHLPSRFEGYGLSRATVERLAADGAGLLVTADCGITSAAEVDTARELGLDVVVTDHHRPAGALPRCPVVHPALGSYPFAGLCAAGVAYKLASVLRERAGGQGSDGEHGLDLVALATVCDLVPLEGENRTLVRAGLRALAGGDRPGLRALMRVAALDPAQLDEGALGFRLGPRLNAAGRVRRADAALELLLTDDEARAAEVADELDMLNRERRELETRILFAAEAACAEQAHLPVHVIAGEGWHPGVVGIVASRMAQRHHRPCVLIALGPEGGRGSGRSIPPFDLHAGLAACAGHLRRFGGHRAAAGLEIAPERVDPFRRDLTRYAAGVLSPADLVPAELVDAVVPATALGLPLADDLRRLAPFGQGNPEPTLLVPATRVENVRAMGEGGQHARFTLVGSGSCAETVAFRTSAASLARAAGQPHDAAVTLELNEWNGRVEARAVLVGLSETAAGDCRLLDSDPPFWPGLERQLGAPLERTPTTEVPLGGSLAVLPPSPPAAVRSVRDRRGEGIAGVAGELLSSGEPVLVVCADVGRRRRGVERLLGGLSRCVEDSPVADGASGRQDGPPAAGAPSLVSWPALADDPALARPYPHLLALDPPPAGSDLRLAVTAAAAEGDDAFCHLAWGAPEVAFALAVQRARLDLRRPLAHVYRRLRERGTASGSQLQALLAGDGPYPHGPGQCGWLVRVLLELELVEYRPQADGGPSCRALVRPRTALERSPAYRFLRDSLSESERYLEQEAARFDAPGITAPRAVGPPGASLPVAAAR